MRRKSSSEPFANDYAHAFDRALTLLTYRARTFSELVGALSARGFDADIAREAAERLRELGYVDDRAFAESLAQTLIARGNGPRAVRYALRQKGVDDAVAEGVLESFDADAQFEAALPRARKLRERCADLPARECDARVYRALYARGFSPDVVSRVLRATGGADDFE